MQNEECTKNVRITHILRTLANLFVFLYFYFFGASIEHSQSIMNLFKQYKRHMKSQFLKKY